MRWRIPIIIAAFSGLVGCGESSTPTGASINPSPTGSTVSIVVGSRNLTTTAFNPNPIAITRGMTITWVNNDSIAHTSTSDAGVWNSGSIAPGGSFSAAFQSAGTFTYHCTIHPNMVGTVTVQ